MVPRLFGELLLNLSKALPQSVCSFVLQCHHLKCLSINFGFCCIDSTWQDSHVTFEHSCHCFMQARLASSPGLPRPKPRPGDEAKQGDIVVTSVPCDPTGIGQGRVTENVKGAPVDRAILVQDTAAVEMVKITKLQVACGQFGYRNS